MADMTEDIEGFDDGLNKMANEGGMNFSGG